MNVPKVTPVIRDLIANLSHETENRQRRIEISLMIGASVDSVISALIAHNTDLQEKLTKASEESSIQVVRIALLKARCCNTSEGCPCGCPDA